MKVSRPVARLGLKPVFSDSEVRDLLTDPYHIFISWLPDSVLNYHQSRAEIGTSLSVLHIHLCSFNINGYKDLPELPSCPYLFLADIHNEKFWVDYYIIKRFYSEILDILFNDRHVPEVYVSEHLIFFFTSMDVFQVSRAKSQRTIPSNPIITVKG